MRLLLRLADFLKTAGLYLELERNIGLDSITECFPFYSVRFMPFSVSILIFSFVYLVQG